MLIVDKSNCGDNESFDDAKIVEPNATNDSSSPVLNWWFGKYIALGGIDLKIVPIPGLVPTLPTITLV